MNQPVDFTIRFRRGRSREGRGYDVEVSDHRGHVVSTVWTLGSRRDAEQEAEQMLITLRARAAVKLVATEAA